MARFTETLRQVLVRYAKPTAVELTQSEIADELGRNRATVHAHCTRLCALGYLRKLSHGQYEITPEGRAVVERRGTASRTIRCPSCGHKIMA
jgi:DNA-binding IclR family transcriptional regulator